MGQVIRTPTWGPPRNSPPPRRGTSTSSVPWLCSTWVPATASSPAAFRAVSSTVLSGVSWAVMLTWPPPVRTMTVSGPPVWKVCMLLSSRRCWLSGVRAAGQVTQPRIWRRRLPSLPESGDPLVAQLQVDPAAAVEGVAHGVDQPGVQRLAELVRGLLGADLDRLGQAQGDPGLAGVLGLRGRGRLRGSRRRRGLGGVEVGDHELRLAAVHPDVDRVVVERAGDLGGGLGERLEQHHPGGRVEGEGEAIGGLLRLGTACRGGVGEVAAKAVDVRRELHDVTMTPI